MCTLDKEGRPWVSILAGEEGRIGYIHYPARDRLQVGATLWEGDAFIGYFEGAEDGQRSPLFASVGIEVSTRMRNNNCPKYITIRDLHPHPHTSYAIRRCNARMVAEERHPDDLMQFILNANSSILNTVYEAPEEDASVHPSHLGANHRGGKPRFLRVVLPDYSGDRIMTSLGNIEVTPLAALTIISFDTGDILYITGRAKNIHGDEARAIIPFQNLLTEIYVMGYTFIRDAFPARQAPGVSPQPSPHDPPLRYLAKEPDQAVFMNLGSWLGAREFRHIYDEKPSLVNNDFIHTWTVLSFALPRTETTRFSLTLREKKDGAVTVPLFNLAKATAAEPGRVLPKLGVDVVGVTPFLSLLSAISHNHRNSSYDITLIVWTREPNAILQLILSALDRANIPPWLSLHIFATTPWTVDPDDGLSITRLTRHQGRSHPASFENCLASPDVKTFICGPEQF
ncbi:hypothetical protein CPC08DRAFT_745300 [Agrocybe pediades]|nr:hypothetical protein CPC08DRAFT_745300 [Agrocybe pediades]